MGSEMTAKALAQQGGPLDVKGLSGQGRTRVVVEFILSVGLLVCYVVVSVWAWS